MPPINLSILDFKCAREKAEAIRVAPINLSILDFKFKKRKNFENY